MEKKNMSDSQVIWWWIWRAGVVIASCAIICMAGCPVYSVYQAKMDGEAVLAHAVQARQVIVTQAEAELEAATRRAKAIEIVGKMAKEYPEYRQQEFIGAFAEALKEGKISQIIYVPTEANIPILEARRGGGGK
jgi:regulator of protease activity HflC (stomatin/prohibitin superfamily)